eukprot:gene5188-7220_t
MSLRTIGRLRIVIPASNVASCIGLNPYKGQDETLEELWRKYQSETFILQTEMEEMISIVKSDTTGITAKILDSAASFVGKDSNETLANYTAAAEKLKESKIMSEEEKLKVLELLRMKVYTNHGVRSEDKTANTIVQEAKLIDKKIDLITDDKFYSTPILVTDRYEFVIVGKIDRIEIQDDQSKVLVEIKNRMNRLFKTLRDYEKIQVMTYLKLVGLTKAKLVEQFDSNTHTIDINWDEDLYNSVIFPGLQSFANRLNGILTNPVYREEYIKNKIDTKSVQKRKWEPKSSNENAVKDEINSNDSGSKSN